MKRHLALLTVLAAIFILTVSARAERFEFRPTCNISHDEMKPNLMFMTFVHEGNEWSVIYDILGTEMTPIGLRRPEVSIMNNEGTHTSLSFITEDSNVIYVDSSGFIGILSKDEEGEIDQTVLGCIMNFDPLYERMKQSLEGGAAQPDSDIHPSMPSDSTVNQFQIAPDTPSQNAPAEERQTILQSAINYATSIFGWDPSGYDIDQRAEILKASELNYALLDMGFLLTFGIPDSGFGDNPQYVLGLTDAPIPDYTRLFIINSDNKKTLFSWIFFFTGPDKEDDAFEFCKTVGRQFEHNGCTFSSAPPLGPGYQLTSTQLDGKEIVFGIYRSPDVWHVRIDHYR